LSFQFSQKERTERGFPFFAFQVTFLTFLKGEGNLWEKNNYKKSFRALKRLNKPNFARKRFAFSSVRSFGKIKKNFRDNGEE
jgi:hypothetical protein